MFARVSTYGIVLAALLMTACSQNETELKTASEREPVAITFSVAEPATTRATNGYAGLIDKANKQLKHTGFGVFAGQNDDNKPDLMYNQKVTYTFLADDDDGYWSYYPIKYWPADPRGLYFAAYAPYVESIPDPVGEITGITGMTANNQEPYLDYTLSDKLEETVDLLWTCHWPEVLSPFSFNMYHALARVAVNVMVKNDNIYKTNDDQKVLISQITLKTHTDNGAVKTGRLTLDKDNTETIESKTCHYPTWTTQTTGSRTVNILNVDNSDSYGIIAEDVRYIDDLPFSWQPKGVEKDAQENGVNALCTGDYPQAYIYFIPNEAGLTLDCTVKYRLMNNETGYTSPELSTTLTDVPVPSKENPGDPLKPLRGNRTYHLNLIIDPKVPTP